MEEAEDVSKDTTAFPDFDDTLLSDLRTSLELFIDDVVWSDKSDYRQLLLADHLFLNERLAKFYGVKVESEDEFAKISFDPKQRSGVLHSSVSALGLRVSQEQFADSPRRVSPATSWAVRSSPAHGHRVHGWPLRSQPHDAREGRGTDAPAACQSCHSVINPLGFSLENYDAVGRHRTTTKSLSTRPASTAPPTAKCQAHRARDVAEFAAKSPDAHRGFVQQLFHHMVKQPAAAYGPTTLEDPRCPCQIRNSTFRSSSSRLPKQPRCTKLLRQRTRARERTHDEITDSQTVSS